MDPRDAQQFQDVLEQLLFLALVFPALGVVTNLFFGKRFKLQTVATIASTMVGLSFAIAVACLVLHIADFIAGYDARVIHQTVYDWLHLQWTDEGLMRRLSLHLPLGLAVDRLSSVMFAIVTGVGCLIHIYSKGYMEHDDAPWRFFTYLNLFIFFMLILILADNMALMFVGWEGVGLCSYLLIGFWYKDHANADAGKKAFVVNRVGDFLFTIGLFIIFYELWRVSDFRTLTLQFAEMKELVVARQSELNLPLLGAGTLLLFGGATGKSAQIPLFTWLPDAMAGPTPVSALIHAATMVTAGVYMLSRSHFLIEATVGCWGGWIYDPQTVIAFIGALTALFAATIAFAQHDIKKVLAYSTVSQLGYMFIGVGTGAYFAGVFHLMTHAFFKACLFLGSGSVILGMHHEQDMRKMGGLSKKMPITYWTFLIATLAIAGVPGLAGFFSKDEILWKAWTFHAEANHGPNWVIWGLGWVAAMGTAFYMFRLVGMTFWGENRADKHTQEHIHESPKSMTTVLIILAVLSVAGGWVGIPKVLGGGAHFEHYLAPVFEMGHGGHEAAHAGGHHAWYLSHAAEYALMGITVALSIVMMIAGGWMFGRKYQMTVNMLGALPFAHMMFKKPWKKRAVKATGTFYKHAQKTLANKYYVDEIYEELFVKSSKGLAAASALFDKWVIDKIVEAAGVITRAIAWVHGKFDYWVIDGTVRLIGWLTVLSGQATRQLQTGRVQLYFYVVIAALVVLIAAQG